MEGEGDIFVVFGLGELLVSSLASSVESLDTSCCTVSSDNLFPFESSTGIFETIITDLVLEIVVTSSVGVR